MDSFAEGITRFAVVVFYAAAFVMALVAFAGTKMWARKISTAAMMLTAASWLAFYLVITDIVSGFENVPPTVLWSRVFHYTTATSLFVMALVIYQADKYGIQAALKLGQHE